MAEAAKRASGVASDQVSGYLLLCPPLRPFGMGPVSWVFVFGGWGQHSVKGALDQKHGTLLEKLALVALCLFWLGHV